MSLEDWEIDPHFPLPTLLVNVEVFSYYRHSELLPVLVLVAVVDLRFSGCRDRAEVVFE